MPSANRSRTSRKSRLAVSTSSNGSVQVPSAEPKPVVALRVERESTYGLERIGDMLRRQRERRGDELQQIANYLCIRKSFLAALENSDYDDLPADAYVIGFLRTYANYLGLDGADAINRYRGEMSGRRRKPTLVLPTPIAEGRTPSAIIMICAAVAAVVIYGIWYGATAAHRAAANMQPLLPSATAAAEPVKIIQTPPSAPTNEAPTGITLGGPEPAAVVPLPPVTAPAPTTAPTATKVSLQPALEPTKDIKETKEATKDSIPTKDKEEAEASAATPAAAPSRLVVRAEKETWVLIADSKGKALLDHVMKAGDTFPVPPDAQGLKLTTGNSSGIVLVLDGKDLPKLARNSSILHDISLDIDKLNKPSKTKPKSTKKDDDQ